MSSRKDAIDLIISINEALSKNCEHKHRKLVDKMKRAKELLEDNEQYTKAKEKQKDIDKEISSFNFDY